ncbi:MAG TPA: M14 family metallopeptidase [Chloroflexota bacterium]|nr:M14 family metallopeptidase [Chloroflexota bacterium]
MTRLIRRGYLYVVVQLVAIGLLLTPPAPRAGAQSEAPWEAIGYSQAGQPIVVYHVGEGKARVLVLGGQHGGPEENTVRLVRMLLAHFVERSSDVPPGVGLDLMPVANPDGLAAGTRQYLSGVDPNRNWGGPEWRADAFDSNGRFRAGLGGPEPFSEQETRALADWILATRPALVINYHSAGGFMFGGREGLGGELAAAFAGASAYPRPNPGGGQSALSYRVTGSMNVWLREIDVPGILVELTTPYDPEFERNMAGVRAVLVRLSELASPSLLG